jgi:chorismate synthase
MIIANRVWEDWSEVMQVEPFDGEAKRVTRLRPGHADLAGTMKYGFDDVRNVLERASARETAARVAVGAICRRLLEEFGVAVHSHTVSIGDITARSNGEPDWDAVDQSPVRCADAKAGERMCRAIDGAQEAGDTLGGVFEMWATGVPIGLGSHVMWDRKLDGLLAQAVMSIHAVKGVEIGGGFSVAAGPGQEAHDIILPQEQWDGRPWRRATNRAGGLEGGMTNGEPVVVRGALKPISTLSKPLPSVDLVSGEEIRAHYERSDVCTVPAAGVIGEAMVAIVLARAILEKFGGDSMSEMRRNFDAYQDTIGPRSRPG